MLLALLPVLFATAAAATAADVAAPATPATAKAEKKICKRSQATESRMGSKRICKTAAAWKREYQDAIEEDARQTTSTKSR